jgi:hypothetical protein
VKDTNSTVIKLALGLHLGVVIAQADYLPIVGPKPLWFGPVAPSIVTVLAFVSRLPPLVRDDRRTSPSSAAKPAEKADSAHEVGPTAAAIARDPNPIPALVGPLPNPDQVETVTTLRPSFDPEVHLPSRYNMESPNAPLLSPQMLLPFFQTALPTGTNRLSVTLPLIFTPALPSVPASSSATYEKR